MGWERAMDLAVRCPDCHNGFPWCTCDPASTYEPPAEVSFATFEAAVEHERLKLLADLEAGFMVELYGIERRPLRVVPGAI